jgi:hypothetical protein
MLEKMKTYFVEVVMKNVGPKVISSLISMGLVFLAAHQDLMEQMGITYYPDFDGKWSGAMPTGQLITVEIATLKVWGAAILGIAVVSLVAILQHHSVATVTGTPQSGDKRLEPEQPVEGGNRAGDPIKGA